MEVRQSQSETKRSIRLPAASIDGRDRDRNNEPDAYYDITQKVKVLSTMEFLSKAGDLNNNLNFKEELFHYYGIHSCADDRLLKHVEKEQVRTSPCSCSNLNAEGDSDSRFCLDEKIEEINPRALPTEPLDNLTWKTLSLKTTYREQI